MNNFINTLKIMLSEEQGDIVNIVNEKLLQLGIPPKIRLKRLSVKLEKLGSVNIDPSTLGLFGLAFTKITLTVRAGVSVDRGLGKIYLEYEWIQPGKQSSGITVEHVYFHGKWELSS